VEIHSIAPIAYRCRDHRQGHLRAASGIPRALIYAPTFTVCNLIVQMGHKDGAAREEAASLAAVSTAAAAAAGAVLTPARVFVAHVLSLKY